jgi:hypothetical protein
MTTSTKPNSPAHKPAYAMPPASPEQQATQKVADRFYELCSTHKNLDAIHELYADDARHIEVFSMPGCDRILAGKAKLLEKAQHFHKITTVHSGTTSKPSVNGDQFVCTMSMDCTSTEGPMANQRMNMSEIALYTVKHGKITEGKFFYTNMSC